MRRGPETKRREAILDAMVNSNRTTFSLSDIVVTAWRRWASLFRLGSYDYPCSATVRNCIYGEGGLLVRGFLVKDADDCYRVSASGLRVTKKCASIDEENLAEITVKINKMAIRHESALPTCRGCGEVDALTDGFCQRPECQKKSRCSPRGH